MDGRSVSRREAVERDEDAEEGGERSLRSEKML